MADHRKPSRALSEEPPAPKPTGPSDEKIIENLELGQQPWAATSDIARP